MKNQCRIQRIKGTTGQCKDCKVLYYIHDQKYETVFCEKQNMQNRKEKYKNIGKQLSRHSYQSKTPLKSEHRNYDTSLQRRKMFV